MDPSKTSPESLRALIVEDNEDDALLLAEHLKSGGYDLHWKRVDTEQAMLEALQQSWDIVFTDYSMPHFNGSRALEVLRNIDIDVPLIFVSGTIGEEVAVEAMRYGAQDYIMKGSMPRLLPAVERELQETRVRQRRHEAEQALKKLSLVVDQTADCVFITDPHGIIEYVNPAFESLTGYRFTEVVGKNPSILRSQKQDASVYRQMWQTLSEGQVYRGTLINQDKNGDLFYEEKMITPLKDEQGKISHFVSTGRDITARVKADEARNRLAAILEATPDMVGILEPEGRLRYLNSAGYRLSGLDANTDVSKYSIQDLFSAEVTQRFITDPIKLSKQNDIWYEEAILRGVDGIETPVSLVVLVHHDASAQVEYLSIIARDISERKHFEERLQFQATHDNLTNLPNRFLLADRCAAELERARRSNSSAAVLFLDLDNFKRVNDSLGHASGDSLLRQAANMLQSCVRPTDTVARHGGDEFTLLLGDITGVDSVLSVLRKIKTAFVRPIFVDAQEIYVAFSVGIAMYPHDGNNVESLLHNADIAMYQAKTSGPSQYCFYAPEMNQRGHELLVMEADLRHAIAKDEFVLYYQPQVELGSRHMVAVESLIRWQHPRLGLVSPADFIPLLESTGLIVPVGEWVLRQACAEHRRYRERGFNNIHIAVNVSAAQFIDENLLSMVRRVLHEESMPAQALELEITENIIMRDPKVAIEILQELHSLGVRIAIDDFGTGYSSLAYLKRFPLDVLKVDQSFVRDIITDTSDALIVDASISLAHKLGLTVVAEGVENTEQLDFLRTHNCDMAQGYYLSHPLPSEKLYELIQSGKRW